jgi:hypothetical protein
MVDVDARSIAIPGGDGTIQSGRFPRGVRGRPMPACSGSAGLRAQTTIRVCDERRALAEWEAIGSLARSGGGRGVGRGRCSTRSSLSRTKPSKRSREAPSAANRRVPDAAAWDSAGALSSVLQSPGAGPATACGALDVERPRSSVHAPSDRWWHSCRLDVARCSAHDRRSRWPCRGDGYSTRRVGIGMGCRALPRLGGATRERASRRLPA